MKSLKPQLNILLAAVFAIASSSSLACTMLYQGPFATFAQMQPVIVRARVIAHGDSLHSRADYFEEMTVAVSEVIKGDYSNERIEFFGDTGMSCLRYITLEQFPIGSEHLFILEGSKPRQPLMAVGESSVRIEGDTVHGRDLAEEYAMSLAELLVRVR